MRQVEERTISGTNIQQGLQIPAGVLDRQAASGIERTTVSFKDELLKSASCLEQL
jgi:hypothetical protein